MELRAAETLWDGEAAFVVNLHDITERKRAEDTRVASRMQSDHLNQVLRTIAGVNQIIIRESDRDRLIHAICDRLVDGGDFHASWIVLTDEDGTLSAGAHSGLSPEAVCRLDGPVRPRGRARVLQAARAVKGAS